MKNILCISLFLLCSFYAEAQTNIAIKAGFNYSTARAYFSGQKQSTDFVPGANLGLQLKTAFDGLLHFSPMITYSSRGYIIKSGNATADKTQNIIHYVDVAPLLSLDFATAKNNSLVVAFGPVAGLAIAGKEKITVSGISSTSNMKFSTSKNYGLFDLALHTSIGYHLKKMFIEVAWQHGLASINNNEENDKRNIRNRTISLNFGYVIKSYK